MSIRECFPMRKRRYQNTSRTPKLSPCETGQQLRRTPRRIRSEGQSLNNSLTEQCALEIIWDNQSPSPGSVLKLGKRKKVHDSDSSSGGEISDLVKKLADQSGSTPEANPLLKLWMCREGEEKEQQENTGRAILKPKNNVFQTPARKPRRTHRRSNRATVKQLTKELELLAHHANEPEADDLLCENAVVEEKSVTTRGIQDGLVPSPTSITTGDKENGERTLHDAAELFDVWESDGSDDLILSQVDMSALYNGAIQETQVLMQTQILGSVEDVSCAVEELVDTKGNKLTDDDCIVTEVWDFVEGLGDSDSEEFLQTALEDFEKSQSVLTLKNKTPSNSRSLHVGSEKGPDFGASKKHPQTHGSKLTTIVGQCKNNSEHVDRSNAREASCRKDENLSCTINSRLKNLRVSTEAVHGLPPATTTTHCAAVPDKGHEEKMMRKKQIPGSVAASRNCGTSSVHNDVNTRANRWTGSAASESKKTPKPVQKYTKEDIERKRMLAQQKRKQKLGQVSKRNPATSRISR